MIEFNASCFFCLSGLLVNLLVIHFLLITYTNKTCTSFPKPKLQIGVNLPFANVVIACPQWRVVLRLTVPTSQNFYRAYTEQGARIYTPGCDNENNVAS